MTFQNFYSLVFAKQPYYFSQACSVLVVDNFSSVFGYYVSTVGLNEATITKYIEDQEKHDIAMDKLSVKEYEDPFKGSK